MVPRVLLVSAMALWAGNACADERSASLVEVFRETCAAEPPTFARTEARANAQNLPASSDVGTPRTEEGFFNHVKTWKLDAMTELSAAEARGPAGEVVSCGVAGPDALGEEVKQDLMKALGIGPAEREAISADGVRRTSGWYLHVQSQTLILLLMDVTPAGLPGATLSVTYRSKAGP